MQISNKNKMLLRELGLLNNDINTLLKERNKNLISSLNNNSPIEKTNLNKLRKYVTNKVKNRNSKKNWLMI